MAPEEAEEERTKGHHGTYLEHAINIEANGFKITPNPYQYWGNGVYFYESGEQDAIEWAKKRRQQERRDAEKIAVILSAIALGECLDLEQQSHRDLMLEMRNQLIKNGVPEETITDAVAINALADVLGTDTVRIKRDMVHGATKLFKGSRLYSRVYLILCVRNLKKIDRSVICYREP
jgi:hypothetical protein